MLKILILAFLLNKGRWAFGATFPIQEENCALKCHQHSSRRECKNGNTCGYIIAIIDKEEKISKRDRGMFSTILQCMEQEGLVARGRQRVADRGGIARASVDYNANEITCNRGLFRSGRFKRGLLPNIKIDTDLKGGLKIRFITGKDGKIKPDARLHATYSAGLRSDVDVSMGPLGKFGGGIGMKFKGGTVADFKPMTEDGLGMRINLTHGNAAEVVGMGALNVMGTDLISGSGSIGGRFGGTVSTLALVGSKDKVVKLEMGGNTAANVFAQTGGRIGIKGFKLSGNVIASGTAKGWGRLKFLGRKVKGPNWVLVGSAGTGGRAEGGTDWENKMTIG